MKTEIKQRINITLPPQTIRLIDHVAPSGDRSKFIDEALQFYLRERSRRNLRLQLKKGALERAKQNLNLVEEWFPLEEQVWRK